MSLSTSPEFYVNMKNPPVWNDLFGWEDQDDDVKQFFTEEAYKVKNGITINGTFIPPWLYWHVNFFPVFQDLPNGERVPAISRLRDNEWFFAEMYQRARQEKKGLGMFGTRRFGKALLDSELIYTPYGSKKIGFADIGDIIYGDDGNLTTIVGVYPQGFVDTYKVTFEDGRSVVCCGQHQWKVKYHGDYKVMSTMGIIHSDFQKMTIDIGEAVDFPERRWLMSPQLLGSLTASFLCGSTDRIFELSNKEMDDIIYSSKKQKELFISSFMKISCGISTGDDCFKVVYKSEYIISFVRRIFWSMGYYCVMDGDDMYISKTHNRLRISDIDYYGKYKATCIEVDNKSHQFLATNFVVSHNTTIMSSLLQMNATMTIGLSHSVVGFSDSDLSNIGEYCEYGLDHVHPFFRINRTKTDWSSGVTLGKRMSNGVRDVHAIISIANINMGRKTSTQKTAGLTPATAIFDEVGKGPIKKPYTAAMPSYDTPYGWRLSPILAGTGGEVELSKDAQEMFSDPDTYNLLVMDWDILNRRAMKGKTWKERKWAMFVPGQMANSGVKRTIGLGDYLGKPDDKKLNKIKIDATDFEASTNKLNEERKKLSTKDRVAYTSHTMFYPFTIDDCFLSSSQNLFPVEYAIKHKNDLLESGQYSGMLCDVFLESGNKLGTTKSNKQLAGFPFSGGVIDAPVQIFEMPQSNRFDDFIYVAGCMPPGERVLTSDGYKNVEDVDYDDFLVNNEGDNVRIRKRLVRNMVEEDLYSIKMYNGVRINRFTSEHPIFVSDHKTVGRRVREDLFKFDYIPVKNIKEGQWTRIPNMYAEERMDIPGFRDYMLSDDFWWFVGMWLGNGWIDKQCRVQMAICFGYPEERDRYYKVIDNLFGVKPSERYRKGNWELSFKHIYLSEWLVNNFGKYCYGKYIPEFAKYLPFSMKVSLVHGYLDTDGSVHNDFRNYSGLDFVSVSIDLLEGMQDILLSIGIVGGISIMKYIRTEYIDGNKVKSQRPCYHLRIGHNYTVYFRKLVENITPDYISKLSKIYVDTNTRKSPSKGIFISNDNKYIYVRISSITKEKYTGPVYNFECDTNNYLLRNISVHNCDPYKQAKSDTPSLGAFYVFKRRVGIRDPYAYRIVASYVSRPSSIDQFCRTCEVLQKGYGAICLMENADQMYEQYLNRKSGMPASFFLFAGEAIANKYVKAGSRQNSKLGLYPTPGNQNLLFSCVVDYCWQDFVVGYDDQTGLDITVKGIELIDDIALLDEIIQYKPGLNVDRIIAFGHALVLARYFDDNNYMPKSKIEEMNNARKEDAYKHHEVYASAFGSVSIGAFR